MEQNNNQPPKKPDDKRPKGNIFVAMIISIAIIPVGIFYVAMEIWVGMRRRWF